MLLIAETHPVQYHAPVYRFLHQDLGLPLHVAYASDFSIHGYKDREFGEEFAWDTDLLSGYPHTFLSKVVNGGAVNYESVRGVGIENVVEKLSPNVGMILGYRNKFDRKASKVFRRRQLPIIFRGEANDDSSERKWFKKLVRDSYLKYFYKHCSSICYIGHAARRHYIRLDAPENIMHFSPYCAATFVIDDVTSSSIRAQIRKLHGIGDGHTVIMYCGKLVARKGPEQLISAVKMLPVGLRKSCHVLFVGEGPIRNKLEEETKIYPELQASYAGFVNQSKLYQYYISSDVMCLPSLANETWGLVVNEALSYGLPVVVSNNTGCADDLVENGVTGRKFKSGSVASLCESLEKVIGLSKKKDVSTRCKAKVANYSIENAAKGILAAYSQSNSASRR